MVTSTPALKRRLVGRRADLLALAWIFCFALLFVSPAIKDGPSFAPADLGSTLSVLTRGSVPLSTDCIFPPLTALPPHPECSHDNINGDQIDQSVPWANENWELVHHGELPLWNDLSGTGMPQLLNFESGSFSLPSLVSYLVPLSVVFLVIVFMKLLICGFGAYVLARLLRCRPLAAAFAGTTAMLSGSFASWLGWSISATFCWAGFVAAGLVWCYREPKRTAPLVLLAVSVAFTIYGGFPEGMIIEAIVFALLVGATALAFVIRYRRIDLAGVGRIAVGSVAGLALAAPLWLSGLSVLRASIRAGQVAGAGILPKGASLLFTQGYYGLPIAGSFYFGTSTTALPQTNGLPDYFESAAYLGVLAIVMVIVAVLISFRRPIVVGLVAATVACLLLAYRIGTPGVVQRLMSHVGLRSLVTSRSLVLLGFVVAILAGLGVELIIERSADRAIRRAIVVGTGGVTVVLGLLALRATSGLSSVEITLRRESLYWPVALVVGLVLSSVALLDRRMVLPGPLGRLKSHPGEVLATLMLFGQSTFLLFAGVGINSYAKTEFPATSATTTLASYVGSDLLGIDDCVPTAKMPICDVRSWNGTGLYPQTNIGYGIDELAVHDPLAPASLFESWPIANSGQQAVGVNLFAPTINTVALARRYGASFILVCQSKTACPGVSPPAGTTHVATIAGEDLVAVPKSARFVATGARIASVSHPSDVTYEVHLDASSTSSTLLGHITNSPGWTASVEGKSASLSGSNGVDLRVQVPAHATEVTFTYSPPHFVPALGLALLALLGIVADWVIRRRLRPSAA